MKKYNKYKAIVTIVTNNDVTIVKKILLVP